MNNNQSSLINQQISVTNTALNITSKISFEDWAIGLKQLQHIEASIHWWIGDLLNYGEKRWGEDCYQAVDELNFTKGTIKNDKWVANAIPASCRHEALSYSHHVEVASLEPEQQDQLLTLAAENDLSVRELRQKVKAVKMKNGDTDTDEYQRMTNQAINIIAVLAENYRDGVIEIETYIRNLE